MHLGTLGSAVIGVHSDQQFFRIFTSYNNYEKTRQNGQRVTRVFGDKVKSSKERYSITSIMYCIDYSQTSLNLLAQNT